VLLGAPALVVDVDAAKPGAQVVARLCEVGPDGASLLLSWGVQVLRGAGLASVRLNTVGHRLRAGHRLRLALASSYWPVVWPATGVPAPRIHAGASCLVLPVWRGPGAPVAFAEPECADTAPFTLLRKGAVTPVDDGAGRLAEVESLVRTSQIDSLDIDGETPLHAAVRGGNVAVIRAMLRAGGGLNTANKHGVTPLHLAVQDDAREAVEILLATGANVEVRDEFGCTPLHDAARRGSASVVGLLLKSGAKAQAGDNFGTTPLHRAARAGRVDVVELLLSAGASARTANSFGKTPVDEAKASRNKEAAEILVRADRSYNQATTHPVDNRVPLVFVPSNP
jgi:hypothetical protein